MKKADAQPKIEKKKKSHKKLYIALGIVAIIVIVLLVMFVLPLISKSEPAVLIIDKGSVEINHGSGWSPAASGIALRANDAVRTLTDSQASIIFFGSSAVRLDQNTEVKISELLADKENTKVSLNQESGRIWNKVTKLSGFEDYSIETPTAVATVRGTGFDSKVTGKDSDITLIEGKLAVDSIKKEDGKKTKVYPKAKTTEESGYFEIYNQKFRPYRVQKGQKKPLTPGTYIEKERYALDMPGEIRTIQKEKRRAESIRDFFGI